MKTKLRLTYVQQCCIKCGESRIFSDNYIEYSFGKNFDV